MKICKICLKNKALTEYYPKLSGKKGVEARCKECQRDLTKKRYKVNPKKYRNRSRENRAKNPNLHRPYVLKQYGLTVSDYAKLLKLQNFCCKICERHCSKFARKLSVDHCHETQKIRGLLCSGCNKSLGYFQNSKKILLRAVRYLG